jgi:hypothetical protein
MDVCDDSPTAPDTGALCSRRWMIDTLRGVKGFSADNKQLDARAHVCDGGIEQVERHVLENHRYVGNECARKEGVMYPPDSG